MKTKEVEKVIITLKGQIGHLFKKHPAEILNQLKTLSGHGKVDSGVWI